MKSESAKALSRALNGKRIKREGSKYSFKPGDFIINWGSSTCPYPHVNLGENVAISKNKLKTFNKLRKSDLGGYIPNFTTDEDEAHYWLSQGHDVVERQLLESHSGKGLVLHKAGTVPDLSQGKLFTQYCKKKSEFRVHVVFRKVIAIQQKAKKHDVPREEVNYQVRNLDNGFIFKRNIEWESVEQKNSIEVISLQIVRALGLDFGAVDIGWHNSHGIKVYEVNTAPGIEESTIQDYANAFKMGD